MGDIEIDTGSPASIIGGIFDDWGILALGNKYLSDLALLASRLLSSSPLLCGSPPS